MKNKLNKKTERLAAALNEDYQAVYRLLCENCKDEAYTKREINYFIRKSIHAMLEAQTNHTDIDTFTRKNKKKWAIDQSKKYRSYHEQYAKRMKECDRVSYTGLFAVVAFSILMIVVNAYNKGSGSIWLMGFCGLVTLALIYIKIKYARKLPLNAMYTYGDIIIFLLIGCICIYSNIFFIIFLWIYEVMYMYYLQYHVVEEDS